MKPLKGKLNILVALAFGLVATFFIHTYITSKTRGTAQKTVPVLIADASVSPGTALRPELIRVVKWPQEIVPPQTASSIKQVENRVVSVPLSKGEPVLLSKLTPEGSAAGMSGLMRHDKLAVTVRTDDVTGVAGFLHPGERVDVLVDMKLPDSQENISKIILQDIAVLSVGQKWEQTGDKKPDVVNTVTLELNPEEAEIINLASKEGKIHLALRHLENKTKVSTSGISTSQLLKGRNLPAAPAEFTASPPDLPSRRQCPKRTVQVIKGIEVTEKSFN
jgi:pilus assembly protein CpaB